MDRTETTAHIATTTTTVHILVGRFAHDNLIGTARIVAAGTDAFFLGLLRVILRDDCSTWNLAISSAKNFSR
jgi:hypothetical protein